MVSPSGPVNGAARGRQVAVTSSPDAPRPGALRPLDRRSSRFAEPIIANASMPRARAVTIAGKASNAHGRGLIARSVGFKLFHVPALDRLRHRRMSVVIGQASINSLTDNAVMTMIVLAFAKHSASNRPKGERESPDRCRNPASPPSERPSLPSRQAAGPAMPTLWAPPFHPRISISAKVVLEEGSMHASEVFHPGCWGSFDHAQAW